MSDWKFSLLLLFQSSHSRSAFLPLQVNSFVQLFCILLLHLLLQQRIFLYQVQEHSSLHRLSISRTASHRCSSPRHSASRKNYYSAEQHRPFWWWGITLQTPDLHYRFDNPFDFSNFLHIVLRFNIKTTKIVHNVLCLTGTRSFQMLTDNHFYYKYHQLVVYVMRAMQEKGRTAARWQLQVLKMPSKHYYTKVLLFK